MEMIIELVGVSALQTLLMVFFSTVFAVLIGFPLGILLFITSPTGITPKPVFNTVLSRIIDVLRSFPFVILMIVMLPLTRLLLGTAIGTTATIIPLSVAASPFVARVIESSMLEIDPGVITAARAMGSTNTQIVYKVLIPEVLPSVVSGITLTIINLISYSAMAGTLGGGGLGDLAIRYGYQRFRTDIMIASVIVIIIMVALIQFAGTKIAERILRKR
ncbi:methionine ABC transporter permease [Treponema pectinovorum]|uniref:methionine ABC transporter permease n=1 Tax=Treponema pectinovorum TaxID=164 RepID=UPI0011C99A29|nr:methionine ABC transporter permease [Treponema pectinovorum]